MSDQTISDRVMDDCVASGLRNEALFHASLPVPLARYSHGVLTPPGARMLVTSGQLGITKDGVIPDSAEDQAVLCFEYIRMILAAGGMSFADVIRFNAYVTDRSYFEPYGKVRRRYVDGESFASTLLVVSGFTLPAFKIEVEAIAARV